MKSVKACVSFVMLVVVGVGMANAMPLNSSARSVVPALGSNGCRRSALPAPSRALIVAGAGHWPHREDPSLVVPEIRSFLGELAG